MAMGSWHVSYAQPQEMDMGSIYYDIPLVEQGENPICWVACMAMIASHFEQQSITIGYYTGGFDPWNSCISDPADSASNWDLFTKGGFIVGVGGGRGRADLGRQALSIHRLRHERRLHDRSFDN
jgi:hypothetical protein